MKNRSALILLTFAAAGKYLASCTFIAPIQIPDVSSLDVEPLDAKVGVYFSPEFESLTREPKLRDSGSSVLFELGRPSRQLFLQLFGDVFREIVIVDSRVLGSDADSSIDAVIEPRLIHFNAAFRSDKSNFPVIAEVVYVWLAYRVILSSRDGTTVATWVADHSDRRKKNFGIAHRMAGEIVDDIMAQAAGNFLTEFADNADVVEWLDSTNSIDSEPPN